MKKEPQAQPLWIDISHIDMPRSNWIWWVIEGTPDAPEEGCRTFNSLSGLQADVEERGYTPPTSAQVNEAVLQARVNGKDDAVLEIQPSKAAK